MCSMSLLERNTALEISPSPNNDSTMYISLAGTSIAVIQSNIAPTSVPATCQKSACFPKFKKLPLELRLIIWDLATPQNRTIEIGHNISKRENTIFDFKLHKLPIPEVLHVNKESRRQALRQYTLFKEARFKPTFINTSNDIILFSGSDCTRALSHFKSNSFTETFCHTTGEWQSSDAFAKRINHIAIRCSFSNQILVTLSQLQELKSIVFSSIDVPENDSRVRVHQKINWALNLVRENELLGKKMRPENFGEIEKVVGYLGSMFVVSRKIRRMVEGQDFKDVPLLADVVLMNEEEFESKFSTKEELQH